MKKLCFPATARPHLPRQQLLLDELKKYFDIDIFIPKSQEGNMATSAIFYSIEFNNFLSDKNYDAILIRGDRYEMLGLAMMASYRDIPIIHLEGGDLSGVIDNKVRHAVTHLSDWHFVTNDESLSRLISMGISPNKVWNYGSLDVEFAKQVKPNKLKTEPYLLIAYHPIKEEDERQLNEALVFISDDYAMIDIASNKDYGRGYGDESYSPEDYINLLRYASCCVGNSSSFLKEASIFGTPVVNIGDRQIKRLKPWNVLDVPCESFRINSAIRFQLKNTFKPDFTYFKEKTSEAIAKKLKEIL